MKRLILCLLLAGCAATTNAYHSGGNESTTADSNASCNASFHSGCPQDDHDDQTFTASSSGFAAPAGALGSSSLEIALITLLVGIVIGSRFYNSNSKHRPFSKRA